MTSHHGSGYLVAEATIRKPRGPGCRRGSLTVRKSGLASTASFTIDAPVGAERTNSDGRNRDPDGRTATSRRIDDRVSIPSTLRRVASDLGDGQLVHDACRALQAAVRRPSIERDRESPGHRALWPRLNTGVVPAVHVVGQRNCQSSGPRRPWDPRGVLSRDIARGGGSCPEWRCSLPSEFWGSCRLAPRWTSKANEAATWVAGTESRSARQRCGLHQSVGTLSRGAAND
jgi:hypothetical protein